MGPIGGTTTFDFDQFCDPVCNLLSKREIVSLISKLGCCNSIDNLCSYFSKESCLYIATKSQICSGKKIGLFTLHSANVSWERPTKRSPSLFNAHNHFSTRSSRLLLIFVHAYQESAPKGRAPWRGKRSRSASPVHLPTARDLPKKVHFPDRHIFVNAVVVKMNCRTVMASLLPQRRCYGSEVHLDLCEKQRIQKALATFAPLRATYEFSLGALSGNPGLVGFVSGVPLGSSGLRYHRMTLARGRWYTSLRQCPRRLSTLVIGH